MLRTGRTERSVRDIDGHLLIPGTMQGNWGKICDCQLGKEGRALPFLRQRFSHHIRSRKLRLDRSAEPKRHGIFV